MHGIIIYYNVVYAIKNILPNLHGIISWLHLHQCKLYTYTTIRVYNNMWILWILNNVPIGIGIGIIIFGSKFILNCTHCAVGCNLISERYLPTIGIQYKTFSVKSFY